jgi:hypothetical protein
MSLVLFGRMVVGPQFAGAAVGAAVALSPDHASGESPAGAGGDAGCVR